MQLAFKNPFKLVSRPYLIVGIFLAGGTLRFYQLDRALGGGDENAMLLYFGYRPLSYIVSHYLEASNHIFHSILVHGMTELFAEDNEMAIRFPSFFFGLVSLWMIYRVANLLFQSVEVALASLVVASVTPIHIYYSQTARGYSLIMFFSIAMIYACLKIFQGKGYKVYGFIFIISGFLSIYTIPTNIFFMFGLAGWILTIFWVPIFRDEFDLSEDNWRRVGRYFLVFFVAIGILTFLAYLPILEQMIEVSKYDIGFSKNLYGTKNNHILLGFKTIDSLLFLIFQGPLKWLMFFLIVGVFLFPHVQVSFRALPICLLIFPIILIIFTGIAGYPRNYLCNLPILVIFLTAGLLQGGKWFAKKLNHSRQASWHPYIFFGNLCCNVSKSSVF